MVFSSIIFLFLFLPVTLLLYAVAGKKFRNLFLLAASLLFYAWGEGFFIIIMITSIMMNYFSGLLIERFRDKGISKLVTGGAVSLNLVLLGAFKYTNFIVDNLNIILGHWNLAAIAISPIHLPIGISFFTFQAMTYVIDVYRKTADVQKNPINIGLYIALFPQLIAGPIVRYHDVAKQIIFRKTTISGFSEGVRRFIYGLGKKVLLANCLAVPADKIFAIPSNQLSFALSWLGIICYTLQIYFDFSGYSDMAIGLGKMFGFDFLENFNYPYISRSIREFWRRWHISLTNWFRDYLYIPLGGNRKSDARTYLNLVVVFFLCGLWHGASWNFVIWGLLHGTFMVLERIGLGDLLKKSGKPVSHLYTLIVVIICWVFFRADTLSHALSYLKAMAGFGGGDNIKYYTELYLDNEVWLALGSGFLFSAPILPALDRFTRSGNIITAFNISTSIFLSAILFASIISLASGVYNPFIYFRF